MISNRFSMWGATTALLVALCALGAPAHAKKPEAAQAQSSGNGVVNLNAANEEELIRLPGVGPTKAERIVAWRKKHGQFKKVEDLMKVKGFGRKTMKKLKPALTLSGPTTYQGSKKGRTTAAADDAAPQAEDAP